MNQRRRECAMCKKPIAFRVWARWDGGTEPPEPRPYPRWDQTDSGLEALARMAGQGQSVQQLVCADHIEHFESGWSRMSGLDPATIVVGHEPAKPPPPLPKGHNIKPETHWDGRVKYNSDPEWGVFVRCRTVTPESAIGRPVDVFVPPEMVTAMLEVFKQAAIDQRKQTMSEAEKQQLDKAN
jgi:hypothetical protein